MSKKTNLNRCVLMSLVLLGLAGSSALSNTIYVKEGAAGDGESWANAYGNLQDALDDPYLSSGDEVWVATGTYYPTTGTGRYKTFQMINGVGIYGGFPATGNPAWQDRDPDTYVTTLSGDLLGNDNPTTPVEDLLDDPCRTDNCYHIFYHPDGTNLDSSAILDGFTFTAGNANGGGSPPSDGGGMCNYNSNSPTVNNCTFISNSAISGGGMYNYGSSNPTVTSCTFISNEANYGGGMSNFKNCNPTITNCTFSGNPATISGGGVSNITNCDPTITNCTFSGNPANSGGGIYNHNGSDPTLTNCTFSGNSSETDGGGIHTQTDSNPTLTNCILWGNTASTSGPQIYINGTSSTTVTYSDVQDEDPDDGIVYPGTGNIDDDPLFADPNGSDGIAGTENDNLRLLSGSPCIDAGDNIAVPLDTTDIDNNGNTTERIPWDLDGHSRFVDDLDTGDTGAPDPPNYNDIVDMGAYERGRCGDTDHPYPLVDFDDNCIVDLLDFAFFVEHWLECTKPECE